LSSNAKRSSHSKPMAKPARAKYPGTQIKRREK
jgi:hypothetical protein